MSTKAKTKKFSAEIGKVLKLMIHSLYTNKDIYLRELISNASDACDKLRYMSLQNPTLFGDDNQLKVKVIINKKDNSLTIQDNGVGMNQDEMVDNLGVIASSGTQKFIEEISKNPKADMSLIGQFGVGFYSSFMVADEVIVISHKAGEDTTYQWTSDGQNEYTIAELKQEHPRGTSVILKLKESELEYLEKFRLKHIITTYSDHISFPIELVEDEQSETVNTGSALWTRTKAEITEEQYKEFYHHVAHLPDTPWVRMHNKVEGNIEFTSLLYIPSMKPFDLFHPDRKTRVKLYVKKVFITDEGVNLVPSYLRFLRGVVDSEDLPLNVSRETLQHNVVIDKIRKSIVKKVLGELKAKANEDAKAYQTFWSNFGEVMKEGLCEGGLEEKEQLLEVCRFNATSGEVLSLDEYIEKMIEGQEKIYYVTGDNLDGLCKHPQLEGFKKRGINVLLLADHVDDFWVHVIHQYKNKELVSITSDAIDLNSVKKVEEDATPAEQNQDVIKYIKEVLKDKVREVLYSTKLVDSPSCLAIAEGAMSARMEKYLMDQKQLKSASAKILEINPKHAFVKEITKALSNNATSEHTEDLVWLMFEEACILEGQSLQNPQEFTARLNKLLTSKLAA